MSEGDIRKEQNIRKNKKKRRGKQATKPDVVEDTKSDAMETEVVSKSKKGGMKRKMLEDEKKKPSDTPMELGASENGKADSSISEKEKKKRKMQQEKSDENAEDGGKMEVTEEKTGVAKPSPKRKGKNKQKKKKKNQAAAAAGSKPQTPQGDSQRVCLRYLQLWDTEREKWHFQKLRQVWLLQNMYDKAKVPKSEFHILMRYMENMKGKAREVTIKKAEDLIKELEDKMQNLKNQETSSDGEEKEDADETKKVKVQWRRATDILQTLT